MSVRAQTALTLPLTHTRQIGCTSLAELFRCTERQEMNEAQRDHLSKALGNVAQGLAVAAPIALATGKLPPPGMLAVLAGAACVFYVSYWFMRKVSP